MIIEYSFYDTAANETETKEVLNQAIKFKIDNISVLPFNLKIGKVLTQNKSITLSSPIDYPLGTSDLKSRLSSSSFAIKNGATTIDVVCPVHYLCNRKYDKFREDIKAHQELCLQYNANLRYILEYRVCSYDLLYKTAQILLELGVSVIYPSTGYLLDDINDNILASALINKKIPNIKIISNGNFWNDNHAQLVIKADLYGIRLNSINGLELLYKNIPK